MAQTVKAILFDFDGVLVDSARLKTAAYLALFPDRPLGLREQIRAYCDYQSGVPRSDKIRHIYQQILREPLPEEQLNALCEQFTKLVFAQMLEAPWITGAHEFLQTYHQQYLLFVISGTPHEEINTICQRRGIAGFFRAIGGSPTSKLAWIKAFLTRYRLEPSYCMFVGDSIIDLHAAQKCNVPFIGVGAVDSGLLPPKTELIADLRELSARLGRNTCLAPR